MLQKARWKSRVLGRHGQQEGRRESGPRVWSVANGLQLSGLCPVLVGCYSEQSHGWAQLEPGEARAAASVHVLIDFLEQGVQQGFALRLL